MRKCAVQRGAPPQPAVSNQLPSWPSELPWQRQEPSILLPRSTCSRLRWGFDIVDLSVPVYPTETKNVAVRSRRCFSRCHATADRLGRRFRSIEYGSMDTLRHRIPLAVPTFHGNCMDVPRRLRPSRLLGSPQGENESSFRHFGNRFAADCACRMQHRAISDAARRHFLLRRSTTESRVPVLRGGIRASAIAGGRSPTAGGVHSLSSIVVRTKRDTVQSRQILMGALFLVSREVSR